MTWYLAINTFTPGDRYGTVISAHRTPARARHACEAAQPHERGSYLPTTVRVSSTRVPPRTFLYYGFLPEPEA